MRKSEWEYIIYIYVYTNNDNIKVYLTDDMIYGYIIIATIINIIIVSIYYANYIKASINDEEKPSTAP